MILFDKDFLYNPNVTIHVETSNPSFIKMHHILKKIGCKNNKFFLALTQPELCNYDPLNLQDESQELKAKILTEIHVNPWYYFREVCRMPVSGAATQFRLNRAILAFYWLFFNQVNFLVIIPRQFGKTTSIMALAEYINDFHNYNTTTIVMNKDDQVRMENLGKYREIRESLPPYLLFSSPKDKKNYREISYAHLKTRFITSVNQRDKLSAEALGRGATAAILIWDEIPFFRFIYITFESAISSMNAAVDYAKENNQLHGLMLATTAGELDTREGAYVYDSFVTKSFQFTDLLYDIPDKQTLQTKVSKNSEANMCLVEYNPLNLGKSYEWIRSKITNVSNIDTIKRDVLNIWTYGSSKSPLTAKQIEQLKLAIREPDYLQHLGDFVIYWYIPERLVKSSLLKEIPIVLGQDTSENIGKDFTTLVFTDARSMEVLGTLQCNDENVISLANIIATILIEYSNILYIPERNYASAIIDAIILKLLENHRNPFLRIYNTYVEENINHAGDFFKTNIKDLVRIKKSSFGFRTTASSRKQLYKNTFKRAIKHNYNKLHDKRLINEILGLRNKKGRVDHSITGNDDLVIAWLLTQFCLYFSPKLDLYFKDISDNYAPMSLYQEKKDNDEKQEGLSSFTQSEIENLTADIEEVQQKIKNTTNKYLKIKLLHELRFLKSLLPDDNLVYTSRIQTASKLKSNKNLSALSRSPSDAEEDNGRFFNYSTEIISSDNTKKKEKQIMQYFTNKF